MLALLGMFIGLGMLRFLVFLLFMYLIVDLFVGGLAQWIPFLSRKLIFYAVFVLLAGCVVILALVVAPRFVSELPIYLQALDNNLSDKMIRI
jgi:hypothetical protein